MSIVEKVMDKILVKKDNRTPLQKLNDLQSDTDVVRSLFTNTIDTLVDINDELATVSYDARNKAEEFTNIANNSDATRGRNEKLISKLENILN